MSLFKPTSVWPHASTFILFRLSYPVRNINLKNTVKIPMVRLMNGLNKRVKNSILVFLILSGFVHLSTLGIINLTVDSTKLQRPKTDTVEIQVMTASDKKNLRLVEQDEKAANDEIPDDAKFL